MFTFIERYSSVWNSNSGEVVVAVVGHQGELLLVHGWIISEGKDGTGVGRESGWGKKTADGKAASGDKAGFKRSYSGHLWMVASGLGDPA